MDINAIGQAGATSSQNSATKLADDFDTFLTLLTEQLKNQDPLEPLDTNEFTSQIVQFTSVEQLIEQNNNLESLVTLQANSDALAAIGYVGKTATLLGDENYSSGQGAAWQYQMPQNASTTTLEVVDASGSVVYSESGEISPGVYDFSWNGQDAQGNPAPAGAYTLRVVAKDSAGGDGASSDIDAVIWRKAVIDRIEFNGGSATLGFGTLNASFSQVKSVESAS